MYQNYNHSIPLAFDNCLPNGDLASLPIDQFAVSVKGLKKDDGFPCSDISILDRFQRSNFDSEVIEQVAQRIREFDNDKSFNGFDDDMKLRLLRPAWCQTATERAAFDEQVYQILSETKEEVIKSDEQSVTSDTSDSSTVESVKSEETSVS